MTPQDHSQWLDQVHSYDHTDQSSTPEYHAAREALNNLLNTDHGLDLAGVIQLVREMTVTSPFADLCHGCLGPVSWPHRATVTNGWLQGHYKCPKCGNRWQSGYAVTINDYL